MAKIIALGRCEEKRIWNYVPARLQKQFEEMK